MHLLLVIHAKAQILASAFDDLTYHRSQIEAVGAVESPARHRKPTLDITMMSLSNDTHADQHREHLLYSMGSQYRIGSGDDLSANDGRHPGNVRSMPHASEVELSMDRIVLVVKTSSDRMYQKRTKAILQTYLRFFSHPFLLSDASDNAFVESVRDRIGDSATLRTECPRGHDANALCCKMSTALHIMKDQRDKRDWFCSVDDDQYIQADKLLAALDQLSPDEALIYEVQCTNDLQPCGFYCMSRGAIDRFDAGSISGCNQKEDDIWLAKKMKAFGIKTLTTPCLMSQYSFIGNGKRILTSFSESIIQRTLAQAVVFPWMNDVSRLGDQVSNEQVNDQRQSADFSALLRFHNERYPHCRVDNDWRPAYRRCSLNNVAKDLGKCKLKWQTDVCVSLGFYVPHPLRYPMACKAESHGMLQTRLSNDSIAVSSESKGDQLRFTKNTQKI